ncbi:uncharacterized protein N7446_010736 [Penicillium canescens]|uniref:Uncharacterized protein n=1 Tax=Penicillium canescens TaxID=5083 RepID=A0AAD6IC48_PENCN|nr:uncharacterized protein N7446_010736 [Penicillium canescens]KAJ6041376.1 hypothetical protein N7460_006766 [Penicillium canescens]KAJ6050627.1 hypothetical protein N7446_010736 [Penicillium canescens]KAJ6065850.1 hypothetical protein N7444_001503 [Penicillium canescens]
MSSLYKLPSELFHLITTSLGAYDLFSLLVVFPSRGSYHQLRHASYRSTHEKFVALIYAIRAGKLDLVQEIPGIPQLIKNFDDSARQGTGHQHKGILGGDEFRAQDFAITNLGGYINPLVLAINGQSLQIVRFLLDSGAQSDVPDMFHGLLPVYVATMNEDLGTVRLLLEYQAWPNRMTDRQRKLPLDLALERNNIGLLKLLCAHGGCLSSH